MLFCAMLDTFIAASINKWKIFIARINLSFAICISDDRIVLLFFPKNNFVAGQNVVKNSSCERELIQFQQLIWQRKLGFSLTKRFEKVL